MSTEKVDSESIGQKLSLADVAFPQAVGEQFAKLYGAADPPENAAEWADAMRAVIEDVRDREPTVDDLCTAADGEHSFESTESPESSQSYICVLDPLIYPFITGTSGTVRSTTPVNGTTVEFEIREDGFDVSHEQAVVSIGVSESVKRVDEVAVETVYQEVCGYIQTFESEAEYDTWAADVDAATTPLSAAEGVAVSRELANVLFDAGDES